MSSSFSNQHSSQQQQWDVLRNNGRQYFQNCDYDKALNAFSNAYELMKQQNTTNGGTISQHKQEQHLLLSNIIACRLKIGTKNHIEIAINESKECILLNPQWSKSYVRLASSYICLREYNIAHNTHGTSTISDSNNYNAYSNDICNALQTAIRYDPQNQVAKQMLLQELRRRNNINSSSTSSTSSTGSASNTSTATSSSSTSRPPPMNPNYVPSQEIPSMRPFATTSSSSSSSSSSNRQQPLNDDIQLEDDIRQRRNDGHRSNTNYDYTNIQQQIIDYSKQIIESIQLYTNMIIQQLQQWWYHSLTNEKRNAIIVIFVLILLVYISKDGSFYGNHNKKKRKMKGNYGTNNIYEQYRREKLLNQQQRKEQQRYENPYQPNTANTNQYNYRTTTTIPPRSTSSWSSSSSSSSSSWEMNGMIYGIIVMGAIYFGQLYGISPWQIIMLLQMIQRGFGGGRYHHHYRHYPPGGGFMWYNNNGGGGMFGRNHHHHHRRWF